MSPAVASAADRLALPLFSGLGMGLIGEVVTERGGEGNFCLIGGEVHGGRMKEASDEYSGL